ncbi:hypothetical protein TNCV_846471 [Trichonephila clavipes]|nr:hypothetical protein TNCV_846471 [Trichonephila clavipes]
MQMIQVLCQYASLYTPRWRYNQEEVAIKTSANSKIHKRDDYPPIAARHAVLLARWIIWSEPLDIVESSGHEKLPTRGKSVLERPGRPRGEDRAASACRPNSDSFNDTSRCRHSNCSTNNFQSNCSTNSHLAEANLKSKRPFRALPLTPEHRQLCLQWCQGRSMWNVTNWQKVVFSDESRFVLGTDDNRVRVWKRPGER